MDYNIDNAPKTVTEMKHLINPATVARPELADELSALVGFPIYWQRLNIVQAGMVWMAWRAICGDEAARYALATMRNIQVEEREKIDPQEVARLRKIRDAFQNLERTILAAYNPEWTYVDPDQALYSIIMERNTLIQALREERATSLVARQEAA